MIWLPFNSVMVVHLHRPAIGMEKVETMKIKVTRPKSGNNVLNSLE